MNSPFPASSSKPGTGRIVVTVSPNGEPGLETVAYQYPLKLIAPAGGGGTDTNDPSDVAKKSALVFLLSYGGGLVAGDQVWLDIDVRAGARLCLVTQGHTKVFKVRETGGGGAGLDAKRASSPVQSLPTRQTLDMRIAKGGALCLLPDPVQPFADSVYEQMQTVRMASEETSLCLLDWVTQGRSARGENWSFTRWTGRNEVWVQGGKGEASQRDRLLVRDAVLLEPKLINPSPAPTTMSDSMHSLAVFGTLILRGPLVEATGRFFLSEFGELPRLGARDWGAGAHEDESRPAAEDNTPLSSHKNTLEGWRTERLALERQHGVLWSAASVRGCVVVKFGAQTVEGARLWIGGMLVRERSIEAAFGSEALMCVR